MIDESLESLLADAVPPAPAPPNFDYVRKTARRRALRRRLAAGIACVGVVAAASVASVAFVTDVATRDANERAAAGGPAPYASDAEPGRAYLECGPDPHVSTAPYASDAYDSPSDAAAAQLSALDADRSRLDSGRFSGTDDSGTYSFSSDEGAQIVVAVERVDGGWGIVSIEYCADLVSSQSK